MVHKCVKWSFQGVVSAELPRAVRDRGRPQGSTAGWPASERRPLTQDLSLLGTGGRRGPHSVRRPHSGQERPHRQRGDCPEGEAREAAEEQALDSRAGRPALGAREARAGGRAPRPGGRRHHRAAGPSGARAEAGARGGGPPGLPRNLSSCCGSRLRTCSTFAMFLGGGTPRAGRPLRGHLGREA